MDSLNNMQEIYVENVNEVLRNKVKIEKALKVNLKNKGKNFFIEGEGDDEFVGLKVLEAIDCGFSANCALQLKDENVLFQTINIKDLTKRNDLERVRARIIGTHGKALGTLKHLTKCDVSLHDNTIGIIGDAEEIEDAMQAVSSLVHGSKHGNVYSRLEKVRSRKKRERVRGMVE